MSDDGTTVPGPAPEPASQDDPTTKIEDAGIAPELEAEAPPEPEEGFDEIEWDDGKKYKVPKPLKDGVLRHKDYTQKSQANAEQRKQVEAYAQRVAQQEAVARQNVQEIGKLMAIDHRLGELSQTNWQQLEQDDFVKAQSLHREYTMLRDQRNAIAYQVQTREQQRAAESQRNFATAYQRTNEQLARDLPHWNQEHADKLRGFAKEIGLTDRQIQQWAIDPNAVKLLDQAFLGRQLSQAQQKAAQTAEPRIEPQPLRKVTGSGAKPATNLADADMETYVAARRKQIAARNS